MGVPRAFRSDNGAEYTNHSFVEYCNNLGILHELTAPYTPQQNGPVESALWRAFKAGHAARLGISNIYPGIRVKEVKGSTDATATSLRMESLLWTSECFNRSATAANDGWLSPHQIVYGNRPPLPLLPFSQPAYHREPRKHKSDTRARLCYFFNFGYNDTIATNCAGRGDGKGCTFARRYVAPSRGAVDPSGNCIWESAHCATGGHLRANAWAQRRCACSHSLTACSCVGFTTEACPRSCADTRNTYATAANSYIKPPGSNPPAH